MAVYATPVNPREMTQTDAPRISVSSISDLQCPRKYRETRMKRNWEHREPIFAVANGTAVHLVMHDIYEHRRGPMLDLSRISAQAKDAVWGTIYPQGIDRPSAISRVISSVRGFCEADDEDSIEGTLHMERKGQFPVQDKKTGKIIFLASATLDRTFIRASEPHRLCIRESKTTKQRISLKEAFLQMWVARKMYTAPEHDLTSWAIEYDFLDQDFRVVRETVEWEDVQDQSPILLRMALRVLYDTDFSAVPGAQCTYCKLRDECSALPGEEVDAEALLTDDETCEGRS